MSWGGIYRRRRTKHGKVERKKRKAFCEEYLQTLDAVRAAKQVGCSDGYDLLSAKATQVRLENLRETAVNQIRKEDILRRLAQLAFGRTNDAMELALHPETAEPGSLDLFAVSECKATERGIELKFIDRIRALETLFHLLEGTGEKEVSELYRVLVEAAEEEGSWEHD